MSVGRSVTHDWDPLARLVFNTQSKSTALELLTAVAAATHPFFSPAKKHVTEMPRERIEIEGKMT